MVYIVCFTQVYLCQKISLFNFQISLSRGRVLIFVYLLRASVLYPKTAINIFLSHSLSLFLENSFPERILINKSINQSISFSFPLSQFLPTDISLTANASTTSCALRLIPLTALAERGTTVSSAVAAALVDRVARDRNSTYSETKKSVVVATVSTRARSRRLSVSDRLREIDAEFLRYDNRCVIALGIDRPVLNSARDMRHQERRTMT